MRRAAVSSTVTIGGGGIACTDPGHGGGGRREGGGGSGRRAGGREPVAVHGWLRGRFALCGGARVPREEVDPLLPVPSCPGCGRIRKPDVVMFGELLPRAAIERARQLAAEAKLLLVVGSSLEVYPVAGLPEEALAAGALGVMTSPKTTSIFVVEAEVPPAAAPASPQLQGGEEPGAAKPGRPVGILHIHDCLRAGVA